MKQPEEKNTGRKPSCLLELILVAVLGFLTLIGAAVILGPMLERLFNSVFGMGLK